MDDSSKTVSVHVLYKLKLLKYRISLQVVQSMLLGSTLQWEIFKQCKSYILYEVLAMRMHYWFIATLWGHAMIAGRRHSSTSLASLTLKECIDVMGLYKYSSLFTAHNTVVSLLHTYYINQRTHYSVH